MADNKDLVVLMTHGADDELSSVAFTVANGGMTAGLNVAAFLTGPAVDLVRRGAVEMTQAAPLEPLLSLIQDFVDRGGELWACTPCVKARGLHRGGPARRRRRHRRQHHARAHQGWRRNALLLN